MACRRLETGAAEAGLDSLLIPALQFWCVPTRHSEARVRRNAHFLSPFLVLFLWGVGGDVLILRIQTSDVVSE